MTQKDVYRHAKMTNAVQNYAWGSHDALTRLYGIANPDNQPMAELWMGAHPKSPSACRAPMAHCVRCAS